ncbi:hypothetical protein Agub_g2175, partial [Astrephomene gubernaculifera]
MTIASGPAEPLRAKGYAEVSWVSRLFFSYVEPLLDRAARLPIEENDVEWLTSSSDQAQTLAVEFERTYERVKAEYSSPSSLSPSINITDSPSISSNNNNSHNSATHSSTVEGSPKQQPHQPPPQPPRRRPWTTLTGITLLRLYWRPMLLESLWVLVEVGQRLGTPVALRQFLFWLQAYAAGTPQPEWKGWVWAVVLGACGCSMVVIHHQLFWIGMRSGFRMRQQAIAAIHSKVLRLNSAAVGALSTGHVVNLVSNDVRRFDDVMPFWIFLWAAPLELCMVLLMVSLELDFPSALAGVASSLAMIPLQSGLVRYIGGLRRNTARCTDERVRLAGEVVEGALAMKMLGWEDPFAAALRDIRGRETHYSRRTQRIRGVNFALQFAITPIVSFVTFAVYRARSGTLHVASVFYALSLLSLPKLYMVNFFVLAVQFLTELRISLQRIDAFLSTPEPPRPAQQQQYQQQQQQQQQSQQQPQQPQQAEQRQDSRPTEQQQQHQEALGGQPDSAGCDGDTDSSLPDGYVAMGGADYDWSRPFGRDEVLVIDTHGTALGGSGGRAAAVAASGNSKSGGGRKSEERTKAEVAAGKGGSGGSNGEHTSPHGDASNGGGSSHEVHDSGIG